MSGYISIKYRKNGSLIVKGYDKMEGNEENKRTLMKGVGKCKDAPVGAGEGGYDCVLRTLSCDAGFVRCC